MKIPRPEGPQDRRPRRSARRIIVFAIVAGFLLIFAASLSAELGRARRSRAVPASTQNR